MKNLWHKPNFFQYTALAKAQLTIGNKGFVGSKTQKFPSLPSTDLQIYDRFSGLKELAKAYVQFTHVSNRMLELIESPKD